MKVHNKLVRDKIPEIIEKDGKTCVTHILSGEKYIVVHRIIKNCYIKVMILQPR